MDFIMKKQIIKNPIGETIMYRQENADGSFVFYTEDNAFIVAWLAEGNTAEEWQPVEQTEETN
jgi:hypothetical protein